METVQAEVGDVVSNSTDRMIVEDVFEEPSFSVGDLVMIVKDTTPGMDPSFSYDKEERITMVMSGRPNHYNVKLLHEAGTEEVTELIYKSIIIMNSHLGLGLVELEFKLKFKLSFNAQPADLTLTGPLPKLI